MDNSSAIKAEHTTPINTLSDLHNDHSLWWRIHIFTYDLRHFRERPDCLSRLDSIVDASYLGPPYFSNKEAAKLTTMTLTTGKTLGATIAETLEERLNRRDKKRVESADYRVCAAHDLAPVFETAFGIKPKELARNKEFLERFERDGLEVGDWTGFSKGPRCGLKTRPGKKSKH